MLKNGFNLNHKIMTLVDPVLIFMTIGDKVVVDKYARFQLSMKHICKDFHISLFLYLFENLSQPSCFAITSL